MFRFATTSITFSSDAREAARLARESGFQGLLFDAYSGALLIPDLSQTGRREFRHVLSSQELALVGLRGDIGPKGFGPGADIDRLIDRIDRAMEAAAGLGSPLLCLEIGPLTEPPRQSKPRPPITPEQAGLIILPATTAPAPEPESARQPTAADVALGAAVNSALAEIGMRADRYTCTVAFSSQLASFAALEQAVNSARCPWFGIDLDPVAMLRDAWDADEIFSRLDPMIRHVRARDAVLGNDRRTKPVPIGQGGVDWQALLSRLDQTGYRDWLTIDPAELQDRAGAAIAGQKKLRTINR
jgi:sugar phosphate isomerase/epimerase